MDKYDKALTIINNSFIDDFNKESLEQSVKKLKEKHLPVIINKYHLSNVLGIRWSPLKDIIKNINKNYYNFNISKRSGGKRKISMPSGSLMYIQYLIKEEILSKIIISNNATGFTKNKSIITNAKIHINQEKLLNIDLKDFFPSIHMNRVYYMFKYICGYNNEVSYCLTKLVTLNNSLPQGAPTSPIISNIVAFKMDLRLQKLADKLGINYSRYADDITFSGTISVINECLLKYVTNIVEDCGFRINEKKTRFASKGSRQEVTGLIVNNGKVNVPKEYIREIRQEIYYIKKFGINEHRRKVGFKNLYYRDHLLGKILYVKSINTLMGKKLLNSFNEIDWDML